MISVPVCKCDILTYILQGCFAGTRRREVYEWIGRHKSENRHISPYRLKDIVLSIIDQVQLYFFIENLMKN